MEKKIVDSLVRIHLGVDEVLTLGNLNAKRDIGHAREYVEGMWRMLQQESPEDYCLATGKTYSIREIVETVGEILGMKIKWSGEGLYETGTCLLRKKEIVKIDEKYFRPSEVDLLVGDPSKAERELGWKAKMDLREILEEMVKEKLNSYDAR